MFDNPVTRKIIGITIIIGIIPLFLSILTNILPAELPEEIGNAITWLVSELYKWDFILPINQLLQVALLGFYVQITFFSINIFLMIWNWLKKAE